MKDETILRYLEEARIQPRLQAGQLICDYPDGAMSALLREFIQRHRDRIKKILQQRQTYEANYGDLVVGDVVLKYNQQRKAWVGEEWYDSPFAQFPDL